MATVSNPRIFLSAGEASGDAYGASLIAALREQLPDAHFTGLGGTQMASAGQHRIVRAEDVAHMGITEVLQHALFIYRQYRKLVACIKKQKPDIAILIDFPDVNFRLAKHLHRLGVPVIWFVSPQLWAWKRSRLRWVQERVDKMLVIFPFEETFYRNRGVDATFVGHPLAAMMEYPAAKDFDAIADTLPSNARSDDGNRVIVVRPPDLDKNDRATPREQDGSREAFAAQHNLDPNRTWIALLPGSRWKEIRANLPALHELAVRDLFSASAAYTTFDGDTTTAPRDPSAYTRYEFLLPVASTIDPQELRRHIDELDTESLRYFNDPPHSHAPSALPTLKPEPWTQPTIISNPRPRITLVPDAREALHHARASVVASGTATVLAAIVGNPFVVVYRVSALTFALAKKLVQYPPELPAPHDADGNPPVAMVNLIAGRRIVPELLQSRFTAVNVADALGPLLADSPERAAQIAALAEVRARLHTDAHPITHVAEAVLALLGVS